MQEYTSPGETEVPFDENLTTSLWAAAAEHPEQPVVAVRVGDRFVDWSTQQFVEEIKAVAKGLLALGVQKDDRVVVHSSTRLEWTLLDYAIWAVGGVTVPIYETSSAEQIKWIVTDSDVKFLFTENAELKALVDQVAGDLPGLEHIFVIDDGALETMRQKGAEVDDDTLMARAAEPTGEDLATIVYTSGTTGRPKGCVITHHNFIWDATQTATAAPEFFGGGMRTLFFLPLAHIFARVVQTTCIRNGVILGYSTGIPQLTEELAIYKPDFLIAVPRVFEKVFNGARSKAAAEGKEKIFDKAAHVAEEYSRQRIDGNIKLGTKILHAIFDKLVYTKLRGAMGGEIKYAVSGGAALGERLTHFFMGIGIHVCEGYGLTETTAVSTFNRPSSTRVGTVGKPVPGGSVKIAEDGEIMLGGSHIFQGYHNNPEATAEVLEDGWFRTGDLGALDGEGFLRITGRKKELIVTAGGKNVAPAVLEDRIRAHGLVSQCMVIGDGQPFIAALVTIDPEAFPQWAEANAKAGTIAELTEDEDLRAEVQSAIDDANNLVSKAESIRTFTILPDDFVVGVELSQKMSVKRHVVAEKYQDAIDEIYSAKKPA